MTDDLRQQLGEAAPIMLDEGHAEAIDGEHEVLAVPPSPTALVVDRWNMRQANDMLDEWAKAGVKDPEGKEYNDVYTAADTHAVLFEQEPQLAANPMDPKRARWIKELMESPAYRSIHQQTMMDVDISAIAAKGLCDQYAQYVIVTKDKPEPTEEDGCPGGIGGDLQTMKSVAKALDKAKEDVDDARAAGVGLGHGNNLSRQEMAQAFLRMKKSELLRRVLSMAGKLRSRCQSLQKQKLKSSSGEIVGIKLGRDISRLIPREKLALSGALGEEQQGMAEYRLLRRRALCHQHKISVPIGAGPIIVTVDESGSMGGERIIFAKALALTMGWLATQQNRWIALAGFSDGLLGTVAFPPGSRNIDKMIEWVEQFDQGGTTLDGPLSTIPSEMWPQWLEQQMPRGKTDHIIITDASVSCSQELIDSYKSWSEVESVKTYGIVVGARDPGDLGKVCHKHWCVKKLDMNIDAVAEVLSI